MGHFQQQTVSLPEGRCQKPIDLPRILRGELAKTIFDQLSPDVKRRFLLVVAGKHRDLFGERWGNKNLHVGTWELSPILCFFL